MTTHKCEKMKTNIIDNADYEYRWTENESGWCLFLDGHKTNYCWNTLCDWCGKNLPIIDLTPPEDPYRCHRCESLIQLEWTINGQNNLKHEDTGLTNITVAWDGHSWNIMNRGISIKKLGFDCPYCGGKLIDPRKFRNKVEIV